MNDKAQCLFLETCTDCKFFQVPSLKFAFDTVTLCSVFIRGPDQNKGIKPVTFGVRGVLFFV